MGRRDVLSGETVIGRDRLIRHRTWENFGFGCTYAWLMTMLFGGGVGRIAGFDQMVLSIGFLLAGIGAGAVFSYASKTNVRVAGPIRSVPPVFVGALGSLMTVLIFVPLEGLALFVVLPIACVLSGCCYMLLVLRGNEVWAHARAERAMLNVSMGSLFAMLLCILSIVMPPIVSAALSSVLLLLGSVILNMTHVGRQQVRRHGEPSSMERRLLFKILAFVASFSFALGSLSALASLDASPGFHIALIAGPLAMSACIVAMTARFSPPTAFRRIHQLGNPIISIGCLLTLAATSVFGFGCSLMLGGIIACDLFMWFVNAEIVARTKRPAEEVLARSCMIEAMASLAGYATVAVLDPLLGADDGTSFVTALALICGILSVVVGSFVFTSHDARRLIESHQMAERSFVLADACAAISDACGLSPREQEVMPLLAGGRDSPYIQSTLVIAQNTAKTHMRNVYRKTGVSNKQELIAFTHEKLARMKDEAVRPSDV